MQFLLTWLSTSVACAAAVAIVPGLSVVGDSYMGAVLTALAIALVNATIKPVAQFLSLPFTLVTLGIFYLVVNAILLELSSSIALGLFGSGIEIHSFGAAFIGSIVISMVTSLVDAIIGD